MPQFHTLPLLSFPPLVKQMILVCVDICLCVFSVWLAFYLRLGETPSLNSNTSQAAWFAIILAIPIFAAFGLYKSLLRHVGWPIISLVSKAILLYSLFYATVVLAIGLEETPRTIGIIQPLLLLVSVSLSRFFARFLIEGISNQPKRLTSPRVIIYGAGSAGRQAAISADRNLEMQVFGFFDDDEKLHGRILIGLPVFPPTDLRNLIASKGITHVFLAMPSIGRERRNKILEYMALHRVVVRTLPSILDIADGRVRVSDIKDLDVEDLLGRDTVAPDPNLLIKKIRDKTVLVTGAGGSIGSELCRQILLIRPRVILLVDNSEYGLYQTNESLETLKIQTDNLGARVVPLLCSVQDKRRLCQIMQAWHPDTIYHAAAYKHVPIVEYNVVEGIKNNVFGTLYCAEAAVFSGVADFVLVSTDKAVRPTNIMGATKRLAEIVIQALSARHRESTCFSMVRFGNVMESSGSVIPLFRTQIESGGPITVTDNEVNRFFMTISEAAQLVIQASAIAKTGDVFVLDMGKPVKIIDLARRMITLSGLSERTREHPEGDIEILITGLRPGEKLYEELLLSETSIPTEHPKIMRAREAFIPFEQLTEHLLCLEQVIESNSIDSSISILKTLVEEFTPEGKTADLIFQKQVESH